MIIIISEDGAQQGGPLGPSVFYLTIHHIMKSLNSIFTIGCMDDVTLGGTRDIVANYVNSDIAE